MADSKQKSTGSLTIKRKRLSDLAPNERNPRRISPDALEGLKASLERFGVVQPVIWNERTGKVVGGHQRLKALAAMGKKATDVVVVNLDPAQEMALNVALNSRHIAGDWTAELESILDELEGSLAEDFEALRLGELRLDLAEALALEADSKGDDQGAGNEFVSNLPETPVTQPGDIWVLGSHRLLCGDCRKPADVKRLLAGAKIQVAVTSPPYASQRKYDESSKFSPIPPDEYVEWFETAQKVIADNLASDGSFFLNIKEHCEDGQRHLYVKDLTIALVREWGWHLVDEFCWTHGGTPKAVVNRFKNGWEPIFHFTKGQHKFRPDAVRHYTEDAIDWGGRHSSQEDGQGLRKHGPRMAEIQGQNDGIEDYGATRMRGWAYPSNVLSIGKNRELLGHGAVYPVALPEFFIKAYSDEGDVVFDPFMGAGTTLIAAENQDRRAMGLEISPGYCDIICRRWMALTGESPVREGDGARSAD